MSSQENKENASASQLNIDALIRQQAARRVQERSKISEVAATVIDTEQQDDENNTNTNNSPSSALRPTSPSSDNAADHNSVIVIAQLKSRITVLEDETESLRAVADLARKENAALRDLMIKLAKKSLGDEWRSALGIDMELGSALAGMGQKASELTMAQRSRLIGFLDGQAPSLL